MRRIPDSRPVGSRPVDPRPAPSRGGPSVHPSSVEVGRNGEAIAARYLALRGFRVLAQNVRVGPDEIDLVAELDGWIIMVEVRTKRELTHGLPEETVVGRKRENLLRAGRAYWVREGHRVGRLRFDLISIRLSGNCLMLRHYPHFLIPDRCRRHGLS